MITITVENTDSKIWHIEQFLLELSHALSQQEHILIHMNGEGPCATSLGLYNLLDSYCASYQYPKNKITIKTWNLKEAHPEYNVFIMPPLKGVGQRQAVLNDQPYFVKKIHNQTKHFGSFVGRGNRLRINLSSYLYRTYPDKSLQSYHTDITNDYFRRHLGLDEMLNNGYTWEQLEQAIDFLKHCPLKLDDIQNYPILHETKVYDLLDYYSDIFVDIVNQTYFTGNTFYIDDHVWRSIITKTPFIVQGSQNFLINLRELGFRTFDQWWDEGYTEDPPDYQVNLIKENIDYIASKSIRELSDMYNEMIPVLDHNFNLFQSLNPKSFAQFTKGNVGDY